MMVRDDVALKGLEKRLWRIPGACLYSWTRRGQISGKDRLVEPTSLTLDWNLSN